MRKVKFNAEVEKDGYGAWYVPKDGGIVATMADSLEELKTNAVESYNLWAQDTGLKPITEASVEFVFDLKLFFEYYSVINKRSLAKRMGMNYTLLNNYSTGEVIPSEKQKLKIIKAVNELGRELAGITIS